MSFLDFALKFSNKVNKNKKLEGSKFISQIFILWIDVQKFCLLFTYKMKY